MKIRLNGKEMVVQEDWTVADLLASIKLETPRVAVEKNQDVVPRATYSATPLQEGDEIEVVSFFGGG